MSSLLSRTEPRCLLLLSGIQLLTCVPYFIAHWLNISCLIRSLRGVWMNWNGSNMVLHRFFSRKTRHRLTWCNRAQRRSVSWLYTCGYIFDPFSMPEHQTSPLFPFRFWAVQTSLQGEMCCGTSVCRKTRGGVYYSCICSDSWVILLITDCFV